MARTGFLDRNRFLVSYGLAVVFVSVLALFATGAPTSLIGAAMGLAIAIAARPGGSARGLTVAGILTGVMLLMSLERLLRGGSAAPPPSFGQATFAVLAAMSLTALLVLLAGRGASRAPRP